jgi:ribosome assembly protein 4
MSTVLPPPSKRQRLEASEKAREQQDVEIVPVDAGSLPIQFFDQTTGLKIGHGPVLVPVADATPKNLELLLNTLLDHVRLRSFCLCIDKLLIPSWLSYSKEFTDSPLQDSSDRTAYRFSLSVADDAPTAFPENIYRTLLKPGLISTETALSVWAAPQAIFRVQAVSRCSATIPGHGENILVCTSRSLDDGRKQVLKRDFYSRSFSRSSLTLVCYQALQFSPKSSSRMVSGSGDNTARIWDCDTGTPVFTLKGHTSWVLAVSWSPDDNRIATGSMDNTVRLWDPKTGKQIGSPMKGHSKWIRTLSWEPYHSQKPGEPRLASSSKDTTVRIWLTNQQRVEHVLTGHAGKQISFANDKLNVPSRRKSCILASYFATERLLTQ